MSLCVFGVSVFVCVCVVMRLYFFVFCAVAGLCVIVCLRICVYVCVRVFDLWVRVFVYVLVIL